MKAVLLSLLAMITFGWSQDISKSNPQDGVLTIHIVTKKKAVCKGTDIKVEYNCVCNGQVVERHERVIQTSNKEIGENKETITCNFNNGTASEDYKYTVVDQSVMTETKRAFPNGPNSQGKKNAVYEISRGHTKLTGNFIQYGYGDVDVTEQFKSYTTYKTGSCGGTITKTNADSYTAGSSGKFTVKLGISTVNFLAGFVSGGAEVSTEDFTESSTTDTVTITDTWTPQLPDSIMEVEIQVLHQSVKMTWNKVLTKYELIPDRVDNDVGQEIVPEYKTIYNGWIQKEQCCDTTTPTSTP